MKTVDAKKIEAKAFTMKDEPRKHRGNLPQSEILDRRARKVGSDDMLSAAKVLNYGHLHGLKGRDLEMAQNLSAAFENAVQLSLSGKHRDAAKRAATCHYLMKQTPEIGKLEVHCRDGKDRLLERVVSWFAGVHFRVADDIDEALIEEAQLKATRERNAELAKKVQEVIGRAG